MVRLRRKHRKRISWKELRRRYCNGGWWPNDGEVTLWNPRKRAPPATHAEEPESRAHGQPQHENRASTLGFVESPMRRKPHVRFGRRATERTGRKIDTALRPDLT